MTYDDRLVVRTGHLTAVARTEQGLTALDFGYRLRYYLSFRLINDLEAVAHFYNNRGYELIPRAKLDRGVVDWHSVRDHFALATRIVPTFVRAWNNLGVAHARLGETKLAQESYHTAIAHAPEFASPRINLGVLHLAAGQLSRAVALFTTAAQLDPDKPHVHYHLAVALTRQGRLDEARAALQRTLEIDGDFPLAPQLLEQLRR